MSPVIDLVALYSVTLVEMCLFFGISGVAVPK